MLRAPTQLRRSASACACHARRAASVAASAGHSSGEGKRNAGLMLFATLIGSTVGLGTWQAIRYQWKVDLVQERQQQLSAAPSDLPADATYESSTAGPDDLTGRRVRVRGVFDHSKEVLIGMCNMYEHLAGSRLFA